MSKNRKELGYKAMPKMRAAVEGIKKMVRKQVNTIYAQRTAVALLFKFCLIKLAVNISG